MLVSGKTLAPCQSLPKRCQYARHAIHRSAHSPGAPGRGDRADHRDESCQRLQWTLQVALTPLKMLQSTYQARWATVSVETPYNLWRSSAKTQQAQANEMNVVGAGLTAKGHRRPTLTPT